LAERLRGILKGIRGDFDTSPFNKGGKRGISNFPLTPTLSPVGRGEERGDVFSSPLILSDKIYGGVRKLGGGGILREFY